MESNLFAKKISMTINCMIKKLCLNNINLTTVVINMVWYLEQYLKKKKQQCPVISTQYSLYVKPALGRSRDCDFCKSCVYQDEGRLW